MFCLNLSFIFLLSFKSSYLYQTISPKRRNDNLRNRLRTYSLCLCKSSHNTILIIPFLKRFSFLFQIKEKKYLTYQKIKILLGDDNPSGSIKHYFLTGLSVASQEQLLHLVSPGRFAF